MCRLLQRPEVRFVTLTGPGGVGKTRLGWAVAGELLEHFVHGVCFVSLAPVSDANLVIATIAQTLGLWEAGDHPPLAVPDLKQLPTNEELAQIATVSLFLQRAQAIQSDFQLTPANARTIAAICARLEGLPLAIELAAARIKLLPPQALLKRLKYRLQVLTGGKQDLPVRQQTLHNTLRWSYDLLNLQEQRLFRLLSIFVGGCSLQAAEAVVQWALEHQSEKTENGSETAVRLGIVEVLECARASA